MLFIYANNYRILLVYLKINAVNPVPLCGDRAPKTPISQRRLRNSDKKDLSHPFALARVYTIFLSIRCPSERRTKKKTIKCLWAGEYDGKGWLLMILIKCSLAARCNIKSRECFYSSLRVLHGAIPLYLLLYISLSLTPLHEIHIIIQLA